MDTSQYLDLFLDESREHLQAINSSLLELEKAPDNIDLVQSIFRSAHTLKGMSATMSFERMSTLTHRMENVLDAIRNHQIAVSEHIVDLCFEALDALSQMVETIASGGRDEYDIQSIVENLDQLLNKESSESAAIQTLEGTNKENKGIKAVLKTKFEDSVLQLIDHSLSDGYFVYHINVELEEGCQLKGVRAFMVFQVMQDHGEIIWSSPEAETLQEGQFEQDFSLLLISKDDSVSIQKEAQNILEVNAVQIESIEETAGESEAENPKKGSASQQHGAPTGSKSLRVNLDRLDELMNLFEELIIERGRLEGLSKSIKNNELTESIERLVRTSTHLRDVILNLRMVPIEQVFNRFPRMVRSVAKELNKQINLVMTGQETELDRIVIDEIGDPLVHLLRNSMDHGIESPEERRKLNKPEEGTIHLRSFHQGNHVYIEIEDDGGGIKKENVLQKAIANQLVTEDEAEALSDQEVYSLLFHSGFSTADKISDLSGRGVGLDVVKSKIEALGGHVEVTSEPGKGSMFSIQLPMTLSIISAMLFRLGDETYAMPLSSILETQLVQETDMLKAHQQEMITYRDRVIPFIRLNRYMGVSEDQNKKKTSVLIVQKGAQLVALTVDQLIGQQEIVIKPLSEYFKGVQAFSGATILGDGSVSLILDPVVYFN